MKRDDVILYSKGKRTLIAAFGKQLLLLHSGRLKRLPWEKVILDEIGEIPLQVQVIDLNGVDLEK